MRNVWVNSSLPKNIYFLRSSHRIFRRAGRLKSALSFLLCLTAAALLFPGFTTHIKVDTPLRVGTTAGIVSNNLYLAQELEYYQKGEIRLIDYPSVDAQLRAFRNKQIDVTAVSLCDALILAQKNPELRGILLLSRSQGEDVLIAAPHITELREIDGKSIGVEASSRSRLMLSQALEQAQLSPQDIQVISLSLSEQISAFEQGTVAAVATHEPVRSSLLLAGGHSIFQKENDANHMLSVLLVSNDILKRQTRKLVSFSDACLKAGRYASQHKSEASERLVRRHQLSPSLINQIAESVYEVDLIENQKLLSHEGQYLKKQVQSVAQQLQQQKLLNQFPPSRIIWDNSIVNQIKG